MSISYFPYLVSFFGHQVTCQRSACFGMTLVTTHGAIYGDYLNIKNYTKRNMCTNTCILGSDHLLDICGWLCGKHNEKDVFWKFLIFFCVFSLHTWPKTSANGQSAMHYIVRVEGVTINNFANCFHSGITRVNIAERGYEGPTLIPG